MTTITFCIDIPTAISKLELKYEANDWRLFVDSVKRNLKGVLLYFGNNFSLVPVAHFVNLEEDCDNLERLLNKLNCTEHK